MINDFKIAIGLAWMVKQEVMEADKKKLWEYQLPEVAATEPEILDVEQCLGHPLDPRYKAFLLCASGWKTFYQTLDLFGVHDLSRGKRKELGDHMLSYVEDIVLKNSGVNRADLLPIAATPYDRDIFVIVRPNSLLAGYVIWFAGEEIDRFPTFDDYFLSMVEYNRLEAESLKNQK